MDDVTRLHLRVLVEPFDGFHRQRVRGARRAGRHRVPRRARRSRPPGSTRNRPDGAIVTHYHEDHAGNVELVASRGVPMWIAPATLAKLRAPDAIFWYRRWCWGAQPPLASPVAPFAHPSLEMIHTPGHSGEHHVVWDAERETVFGADLFLGVKVRVTHPWPREDVRAQIASLRAVIALQAEALFRRPPRTRARRRRAAHREGRLDRGDRRQDRCADRPRAGRPRDRRRRSSAARTGGASSRGTTTRGATTWRPCAGRTRRR